MKRQGIVSLAIAIRFAKEKSQANPDRQICVALDAKLGDDEFRIVDDRRLSRIEASAVGFRRLQVAAAEAGGQYEGVTPPLPQGKRLPVQPLIATAIEE